MSGDHNQFQKPKSYLDDMNEVRKVLEMALIALEDANDMFSDDCSVEDVYADEIEALTKVLEKESFECPRCGHCCYVDDDDTSQERVDETVEQEHEPVAWISDSPTKGNGKQLHWTKAEAWRWSSNIKPLYTAPQKREWQGLTDDVVFELADTNLYHGGKNFGVLAFAKAIEQALKEKNT